MARVRRRPADNKSGEPETGVPVEQCLVVQDEIWRIVSDAARDGSSVSIGSEADRIVAAFPAPGLSLQSVKDALVFAAVDCGAAIVTGGSSPRPAVKATNMVPALFALVGGRRKEPGILSQRPTFAGDPLPAAG